jgi:hypothetical protein
MSDEKSLGEKLKESMLRCLISGKPMLTHIGDVLDQHFEKVVTYVERIDEGKLYIELEDGVKSAGMDPISRSKRTYVFDLFYSRSSIFG